MEREGESARSFEDAARHDREQQWAMTPDERMAIARALRERVYGTNVADVRESERGKPEPRRDTSGLARTAAAYFAVVFAAGFALGMLRVLGLAPRLGERTAELVELPVMLLVSWLAACRLVGRDVAAVPMRSRLAIGALALTLMFAADVALGMTLRGLSLRQVFLDREPVAGSAYFGSLVAFASMPWLAGRGSA